MVQRFGFSQEVTFLNFEAEGEARLGMFLKKRCF
jgi:hypothetical protein